MLHTGVSSQERHERLSGAVSGLGADRQARQRRARLGRSRRRNGHNRRPRARDGGAAGRHGGGGRGMDKSRRHTRPRHPHIDGLLTGLHASESSHLDILRALLGEPFLAGATRGERARLPLARVRRQPARARRCARRTSLTSRGVRRVRHDPGHVRALALSPSRAHSSAGERSLHTREVPGSIPGAPIHSMKVLHRATFLSHSGLGVFSSAPSASRPGRVERDLVERLPGAEDAIATVVHAVQQFAVVSVAEPRRRLLLGEPGVAHQRRRRAPEVAGAIPRLTSSPPTLSVHSNGSPRSPRGHAPAARR